MDGRDSSSNRSVFMADQVILALLAEHLLNASFKDSARVTIALAVNGNSLALISNHLNRPLQDPLGADLRRPTITFR